MSDARILVGRTGPLATVTLNRPDQHNVIDLQAWHELAGVFEQLAADSDLRGVIVTGAGKSFSAGADIADFEQTRGSPEQGIAYERAVDVACDAIAGVGCPVIAAIRGYCYGGACNIAMASDFRFVSPDARFAIPAAKLSIVYSSRGMTRLAALVGLTEAKRIFYTGRTFDAAHAMATGFADEIADDPVVRATEWLTDIVDLAPLSIAGSKRILDMIAMTDRPFDMVQAEMVTYRALASEDYREGRLAFREKRAPGFKGK